MAYGIMRHEKAKGKANIRNICKHIKAILETVKQIRDNDLKTTEHTSICIENLQYNYSLISTDDFNKEIDKTLKEKMPGKTIRKDAVTLLDGVYTVSPERIRHLEVYLHRDSKDDCPETLLAKKEWREEHKEWITEYNELMPEERKALIRSEEQFIKDYATKCVEFESKHYGICINATVHFHEETVHIHTDTIPIIKGDGKGEWTLSAKTIMGNKRKLSEMQSEFYEEVCKDFGLERGKCRTASELKKHTTKEEWKYEQIKAKYEQMEAKYNNLVEDYENLESKYMEIVKQYASLDARISVLNDRMRANISNITTMTQKTINGQIKAVEEARKRVEEAIKNGTAPDIIFGSIRTLNHEIGKVEQTLDEVEDYER